MTATRFSRTGRREDKRTWWLNHLRAQGESEQTQAAYCRAHGLVPRYFTRWQGKLRPDRGTVVRDSAARLVPVVIRSERAASRSVTCESSSASTAVPIRLNLGNGMSLSLELAARRQTRIFGRKQTTPSTPQMGGKA
jgi:hypothetical protein